LRRERGAGEVGDRDADDPVDGADVVRLEGIHDEVEAVGQTGDGSKTKRSIVADYRS
jgi:hypothetical protein